MISYVTILYRISSKIYYRNVMKTTCHRTLFVLMLSMSFTYLMIEHNCMILKDI